MEEGTFRIPQGEELIQLITESLGLDIAESTCDLSAIFNDLSVLPSNSSSPSIQMLASIKPDVTQQVLAEYISRHPPGVFIKLSLLPTRPEDNRFEEESGIYRYLLVTMLLNNVCPNVMRFVASF